MTRYLIRGTRVGYLRPNGAFLCVVECASVRQALEALATWQKLAREREWGEKRDRVLLNRAVSR
jgi:hypothetical protein